MEDYGNLFEEKNDGLDEIATLFDNLQPLNIKEKTATYTDWYDAEENYISSGYWMPYTGNRESIKGFGNLRMVLGNLAIELFAGKNSSENPIYTFFGGERLDESAPYEVLFIHHTSKDMKSKNAWKKVMDDFWDNGDRFKEALPKKNASTFSSEYVEKRELADHEGYCLRFGFDSEYETNVFLNKVRNVVMQRNQRLAQEERDLITTVKTLTTIDELQKEQERFKAESRPYFEVKDLPCKNEWIIQKEKEAEDVEYEWRETHYLAAGTFAFKVQIGMWTNGKLLENMLDDQDVKVGDKYKVKLSGASFQGLHTFDEWEAAFSKFEKGLGNTPEDFGYSVDKYLAHPLIVGEREKEGARFVYSYENEKEARDFMEKLKATISEEHNEFFEKEKALFDEKMVSLAQDEHE